MNICLLVSGNLGNLVFRDLYKNGFSIQTIFTNKHSKEIIDFAKQKQIPVFIGNPRKGKANAFIKEYIDCDVLLSVNYLYIIENDLIQLPKQYAINVHGSLLPKYRGRTPHVWAIINGEKETGITAHLISPEVDKGAILKQQIVPIETTDTGGDILQKYNIAYPSFIKTVLTELEKGAIKPFEQEHHKATYFGKRTPKDGQINWDWSKERIYNWIRAQAKPYPGAFTFVGEKNENQKLTIHKAVFSDFGFKQEQKNGTILHIEKAEKTIEQIIVKTPNGALTLSKLEGGALESIIQNTILH